MADSRSPVRHLIIFFNLPRARFVVDGLPFTRIGNLEISKIVCGTNPFFGFSHFTRARDMWMREYFTDDRIKAVIRKACQLGINAVVSGTVDRLFHILCDLRKEGSNLHWICTPGGSTIEEVETGIRWSAEHELRICMPHQNFTDAHLAPTENQVIGYDRLAALIRSLGMVPGLSTHRPETIVVMDRAMKDVETYIVPYNILGFLSNVEVEWVRRVIRNSPKPILVIKPLGAARITPEVGLPFVLKSIKERDAVCLGFSSVQEVEEDLEIVRATISGDDSDLPLTTSRSKAIFEG